MEHIKKLALSIVTALQNSPDGFTIDTKGNDQAGRKAYALSTYKKYELVRNFSRYKREAIESIIADWLNEVMHLLPYPFGLIGRNTDNCIGGWQHEGKIYLDIITLLPKSLPIEEVHKIAKENGQIAFFDLENLTTITTR